MVRIPNEYQEVEYIQGTSNARIDTGIPGNNDSLVISGKVYLNKFSAYQGFFGNYIDENHNTSRLILSSSANGAVIVNINRRAASSSVTQVGLYAGNTVEFKVSKTKLVFNGTEYSYGGVNNATANATNILLNVANPASTVSNSELYKRWYYFRIHDGDIMLQNFIPCYRKSDSKPGMYDTVTNQFFAGYGTEEFIVGNDVSWDTASLIERRRQILLNTPHITTESANPLTFQTDISAPIKGGKIYFEPTQEGTGDPSPDNVRPISGWDGVTVYKSKRNLLITDGITFTGSSYINKYGNIASSRYYKRSNPISCSHIAGKTVTFNTVIEGGGSSITSVGFYSSDTIDSNHAVLLTYKDSTSDETITVTIPLTAKYMVITLNNSYTLDGKYIVEGTEPPNEVDTPTAITLPFPQTIYGGYVDLVKGEVMETDYLLTVDENTAPYNVRRNTGGRVVGYYNLPYAGIKDAFTHYSHGQCIKSTTATYNYQVAGCVANEPYNTDAIRAAISASSDITTVEQYPGWIASVEPLQIVYELATPITHQLTPQTIKTLKGINNIWSDANGNIELRFWKH